jgi:hypothetical protein
VNKSELLIFCSPFFRTRLLQQPASIVYEKRKADSIFGALRFIEQAVSENRSAIGKESVGMERIDRLYALLERDDIDEDTKAALRWAIFQLENAT